MPENAEPDVPEGAQVGDATPPVGDGGSDRAGGERAILADLARERDRRQALEQEIADVKSAQQTQLDAIAKALGLKDDARVEPEALAAELASTRKAKRDADLRVAVYDAAGKLGANPGALLDSLSFIKSLDDVDTSDAGVLEAAVKAALDANPGLVAPRGSGWVAGSANGGARRESAPGQLSKADVDRMFASRQYDEIEKARQEGRLNQVLGIKP